MILLYALSVCRLNKAYNDDKNITHMTSKGQRQFIVIVEIVESEFLLINKYFVL